MTVICCDWAVWCGGDYDGYNSPRWFKPLKCLITISIWEFGNLFQSFLRKRPKSSKTALQTPKYCAVLLGERFRWFLSPESNAKKITLLSGVVVMTCLCRLKQPAQCWERCDVDTEGCRWSGWDPIHAIMGMMRHVGARFCSRTCKFCWSICGDCNMLQAYLPYHNVTTVGLLAGEAFWVHTDRWTLNAWACAQARPCLCMQHVMSVTSCHICMSTQECPSLEEFLCFQIFPYIYGSFPSMHWWKN